MSDGNLQDEIQQYEQALAAARQAGDKRAESVSLMKIAGVHWRNGQRERSIELCRQALEVERETGDRKQEAEYILHIGNLLRNITPDSQEGQGFIERAMAIARDIGNREIEAEGLYHLAYIRFTRSAFDEAIRLAKDALAINRALQNKWGESYCLYALGRIYHAIGDEKRCVCYFREAHTIAEKCDNHYVGFHTHRYFEMRDRFPPEDKSVSTFEEALSIARETGNRYTEQEIIDQEGQYAARHRDFPTAYSKFKAALALARELNEYDREIMSLHGLSLAYSDAGNLEDAIRCGEEALTIARERNDMSWQVISLEVLGLVYNDAKRYSAALPCYEQALEIAHNANLEDTFSNLEKRISTTRKKLGEADGST